MSVGRFDYLEFAIDALKRSAYLASRFKTSMKFEDYVRETLECIKGNIFNTMDILPW